MASDPHFLTHHALRIKGFAKTETLADMMAIAIDEVESHLRRLAERQWAMFREARSLWQLTPEGKAAHAEELRRDLHGVEIAELGSGYETFLETNQAFKQLCTDWQLRDGAPNDHSDAAYDRRIVERLAELHGDSRPIVVGFAEVLPRLSPYAPRLDATLARFRAGESNMFTGVMCGSYHDVWMELHEDLILTQGIDRGAEGSF